MFMIKVNKTPFFGFVAFCVLFVSSSMAEPTPVFAKDPSKPVDYSQAEGVSLHLSKVRKDYFEINVSAPATDSADCYCPVWSSKPVSTIKFFAISLDEPGQCEDTITINGQGCGLVIHSGSEMAKWIDKATEGFKAIAGQPDTSKFYLEGANISIPDSTGVANSYWGEFPIYELSGQLDTLEVTFSLQQECVIGSLKAKTKLFRKRGLTIRLVIDQRKDFPVITKIP